MLACVMSVGCVRFTTLRIIPPDIHRVAIFSVQHHFNSKGIDVVRFGLGTREGGIEEKGKLCKLLHLIYPAFSPRVSL